MSFIKFKFTFLSLIAVILIMCSSIVSHAKGGGNGDDDNDDGNDKNKKGGKHLIILNAEPDLNKGTLLISGKHFGDDAFRGSVKLFVPTLGVCSLDFLDFDPQVAVEKDQLIQELLVTLPEEIADFPGTYLLSVKRKRSHHHRDDRNKNKGSLSDVFYLTIGSGGSGEGNSGPTGSEGDPGPPGIIQGPVGATGSGGSQGTLGNTGPQGSQGPTGPTGDQGDPGPTGPAGEAAANCAIDSEFVDFGNVPEGFDFKSIAFTNTSGMEMKFDIQLIHFTPGTHFVLPPFTTGELPKTLPDGGTFPFAVAFICDLATESGDQLSGALFFQIIEIGGIPVASDAADCGPVLLKATCGP